MNAPEVHENPTAALRRLHRWRMALSGLAILIAGITIGAAGAVLIIRPTDRRPPPDMSVAVRDMVGRFREVLDLSDEQVNSIRSILRQRMENLEKIRTDARPLIEAELQAMKTEIDQVLTEEQRNHWQRITERLEREFHRGMRRPGGRGGPRDGFRDDRRGDGRFGPGDRRDPNGLRRDGRRFMDRDPNDARRFQDWRGDPNGLRRRGGPRPDWQDRDGPGIPPNQAPDMGEPLRQPPIGEGPSRPVDTPVDSDGGP